MTTQSEYELENALIAQLVGMEYELVRIENDSDMRANFKRQLEIHRATPQSFLRWIPLSTSTSSAAKRFTGVLLKQIRLPASTATESSTSSQWLEWRGHARRRRGAKFEDREQKTAG